MQPTAPKAEVLRFGIFEVDLHAEELRKGGLKVRLPGQSFQILRLLLQRPGELVTRDELRQALWPSNHYVDFDHGLNAAVTRMRDALGDSADSPRFVETLPRRGYRFIGTLQPNNGTAHPDTSPTNGRIASVALPEEPAAFPWTKVMAIVTAVALVLLVVLVLRHKVAAPLPNLAVTPFTSLPRQEVNPAVSPDGTRIVFSWDGDPEEGKKGFDLYVKEIGSEHLLRLTRTADRWLVPTWSSDGRFIVFTRSGDNNSGIYTIPALGGDERLLKKDAGDYNAVSLSADGRYLAYPELLPSTLSRVALLDMQSLASLTITLPTCLMTRDPAFSSTGHRLAFTCTPSWGITDVYIAPEIGDTPHKIARVLGFPNGLAWTPGGRSLVLGVSRGRADLWRIDVNSGKTEPILVGSHGSSPAVAIRGNLMAFEERTETSNIWRLDLSERSVSRLIASTRYEQNAKYSPDGQYVVFESSRSGFPEIWMSRVDGSDILQLTHFDGPLTGSPAWSPDSRHFVFDSRDTGESNLYIMDVNERVPRRVQTDVTDNSVPSYSHDGRWIYFRSDASGRGGIYRVSSSGGHATLLVAGEGYQAVESADGRDLYYALGYKRIAVHRLSLVDGTDVLLNALPSNGQVISWTPAPGGLYYMQVPPTGGASIHFYDTVAGGIRKIADLPKDKQPTLIVGGLSLSPDGHSLLYAQIDQQESDIMLVENFR
jgi:Tol biopolymer transport system component/DNA-binding winged helix-turn-helix (wHTH) protein